MTYTVQYSRGTSGLGGIQVENDVAEGSCGQEPAISCFKFLDLTCGCGVAGSYEQRQRDDAHANEVGDVHFRKHLHL